MASEPIPHGNRTPASRTTAEKLTDATQLIRELEGAGLVMVEVGDDEVISLVLTARGKRAARLMAMSRDGHALVLLGALVGTEHGPN